MSEFKWKCARCGDECGENIANPPTVCPNPNCDNKNGGEFKPNWDPTDVKIPDFVGNSSDGTREEILNIIEYDVKKDRKTTESILLTALSTYSDEPQNLFMKGPSSAGKSHAIVNTTDYFSRDDVELLGSLSPKALVHQKGTIICEDGQPLPPKPGKDASDGEKRAWKSKAKKAKSLIDLQGKILVFLEAPKYKTYEMLRPILSHDTWEHEHKFAESSGMGIYTNTVVIRGWPSTIFATTEVDFIEDLVTRSLTITPRMSKEKYGAANKYAAENFEVPLKNPDDERKKKGLKEYLESVRRIAKACKVAIPYASELAKVYPSRRPQDMRDFKKFLSLIQMETFLHAFERPIVRVGENWIMLSTGKDLKNALKPFKKSFLTTQTGLGQDVIDAYKKVFLPLKDEQEDEKLGYSKLTEKYRKEMGVPISREWMRTKFVEPLEHIGWVDVRPDPDDRRKKQFKVQGEIKTFENLCVEIQDIITEETIKTGINKIKKYHDSDKNMYNGFSIYKSLSEFTEKDIDYLIDKIGNESWYLESSEKAGNEGNGKGKVGKNEQRYSKVNQENLAKVLADENPKVQELGGYFGEANLEAVNNILLEWKKDGDAYLDEDGRWRLN